MKRICFAGAAALAVLVSGCATRVVYTSAPPPPPPPSTIVVQSPPPPSAQPAPPADAQSAQAAAPQPAEAAAPQAAPAPVPQPPPTVVVPTPPPAPPPGYVPDYYVWDGYEYVGVYGDQSVYWTGGTWIVCDPIIVARFHGWEHSHPYWRHGGYHYYYRGGRGRWR